MKIILLRRAYCILLLTGILMPEFVYPDNTVHSLDVRSLSLGNTQAVSNGRVNPAYIPYHSKAQVSVAVHNRYQLKELNRYALGLILPNRYLNTGINLSKFGFSGYSLLQGELGLSKKISNAITLGGKLAYVHESFEISNTTSLFRADLGVVYQVSDKLKLALLTTNLASNIRNEDSNCHLGAEWNVVHNTFLLIETSTDFASFYSLSAGIEYQLFEGFLLRAGYQTEPSTFTFGLGYLIRSYQLEFGFSNHSILGNNTSLGIAFLF